MDKEELEELSFSVLSEIKYKTGPVPLEDVCEFLRNKFGLVVKRNSQLNKGVLGCIAFGPDVISIDDFQASSSERVRFTLAHEIGHFILEHRKFMVRESCHEKDIEVEYLDSVNLKDVRRMEWQANYFASCLLLPRFKQ